MVGRSAKSSIAIESERSPSTLIVPVNVFTPLSSTVPASVLVKPDVPVITELIVTPVLLPMLAIVGLAPARVSVPPLRI